jgi:hypothetical protein
MECLRTANITISGVINDTSTVAGCDVNFFTDYASKMTGVIVNIPLVQCQYFPQGFKNIDLYALEIIGSVLPQNNASGAFICSDYTLQTAIFGAFPLLGATIPTGTPFQMTAGGGGSNGFSFTKTFQRINFYSPVKSVSQIACTNLYIEGSTPTLIGITQEINLRYSFDIFLHYKFEGE